MVFKQIPAKISSALINGLNPVVDQYFSAQLIVGSLAALNFGYKIPAFAIGIIGIALGNVLLPYFSNLAAENKAKTLEMLKKLLRFSFVISAVISAIIIILSQPIVSIIFERNAFTPDDTLIVYKVQQMYLLQVPFYITGMVMNRYLTAINKNNFLVISSLVSLILNTTLNIILIDMFGIYGLALATSMVSMINCLLIYLYINHINKKQYV